MHKKRLKSTERKQVIATGGGPPPQQDPANSEDISVWLPNEFVIDTNEFDSDQINQASVLYCVGIVCDLRIGATSNFI